MDHEDKIRTLTNKQRLLQALKARRVLTNEEARRIAGSRAMGRCHELIQDGEPITVRKLSGSIWELRYNMPALARDASTKPAHWPDAQRDLPL